MIAARDVTLGILAGGRGSRLGGGDKAWIERDGVPQVVRIARRFAREAGTVLISANRDAAKYERLGLHVVADRVEDLGPIGGLDALATACATPWLLTIPVDLVAVNDCLLPTLASAGGAGASIEDDDGVQPLVALWNAGALRDAHATLLARGLDCTLDRRARRLPFDPEMDAARVAIRDAAQACGLDFL